MKARDVTLAPRCRRDVTDGGLGGCVEAQGARATSSGGCFAMVIHRTHPVPAYGGPEAVTGGSTGRRDGPTDPDHLGDDQEGKGVTAVMSATRHTRDAVRGPVNIQYIRQPVSRVRCPRGVNYIGRVAKPGSFLVNLLFILVVVAVRGKILLKPASHLHTSTIPKRTRKALRVSCVQER